MGRLNIMRMLSAPAAIWLITSFVLATPMLGEVPLANLGMAQPAFSGLAPLSYSPGSPDLMVQESPSEVEARL